MSSSKKHVVFQYSKRIVYLIILAVLIFYLYTLGKEPWLQVLKNSSIFLVAILLNMLGIVIQAISFRFTQPKETRNLPLVEMIRIWSLSGFVSVIAPVFAGIATRTTLLIKTGIDLKTIVITSIRQLWMGLEYAILLGGIAAILVEIPGHNWLAGVLTTIAIIMMLIRKNASSSSSAQLKSLDSWITALKAPVVAQAHPWFILQIFAMSAIYYIAYNGLGAKLDLQEAVLLSAMTVLASLVVILPNGVGLLDTLWVLLARRAGLQVDAAAALAIIIRLSYLFATICIWVVTIASLRITRRNA